MRMAEQQLRFNIVLTDDETTDDSDDEIRSAKLEELPICNRQNKSTAVDTVAKGEEDEDEKLQIEKLSNETPYYTLSHVNTANIEFFDENNHNYAEFERLQKIFEGCRNTKCTILIPLFANNKIIKSIRIPYRLSADNEYTDLIKGFVAQQWCSTSCLNEIIKMFATQYVDAITANICKINRLSQLNDSTIDAEKTFAIAAIAYMYATDKLAHENQCMSGITVMVFENLKSTVKMLDFATLGSNSLKDFIYNDIDQMLAKYNVQSLYYYGKKGSIVENVMTSNVYPFNVSFARLTLRNLAYIFDFSCTRDKVKGICITNGYHANVCSFCNTIYLVVKLFNDRSMIKIFPKNERIPTNNVCDSMNSINENQIRFGSMQQSFRYRSYDKNRRDAKTTEVNNYHSQVRKYRRPKRSMIDAYRCCNLRRPNNQRCCQCCSSVEMALYKRSSSRRYCQKRRKYFDESNEYANTGKFASSNGYVKNTNPVLSNGSVNESELDVSDEDENVTIEVIRAVEEISPKAKTNVKSMEYTSDCVDDKMDLREYINSKRRKAKILRSQQIVNCDEASIKQEDENMDVLLVDDYDSDIV